MVYALNYKKILRSRSYMVNTVLDMAYSVTLIRPTDAAGTAS